jgi:hypothetical protein
MRKRQLPVVGRNGGLYTCQTVRAGQELPGSGYTTGRISNAMHTEDSMKLAPEQELWLFGSRRAATALRASVPGDGHLVCMSFEDVDRVCGSLRGGRAGCLAPRYSDLLAQSEAFRRAGAGKNAPPALVLPMAMPSGTAFACTLCTCLQVVAETPEALLQ